jgi:cytochrome c peroxidase
LKICQRGSAALILVAVGLIAIGLSRTSFAAVKRWPWTALPATMAPPPVPADNVMTAAKIALGRQLFYEPALSSNGTLPCAECHQQQRGFTDGLPRHIGVSGDVGLRNVPGLANVAWRSSLTWADPSVTSLEQQALVPMTGEAPIEMGMHGQDGELLRRLSSSDCYKAMFASAFPEHKGRIDFQSVAAALSAFQRTMVSFDSPYDRYLRGDKTALSPIAQQGAALFKQIGCTNCHSGQDMTDNQHHYVGTEDLSETCGYGRKECDENDRPDTNFRTPSLRNVAVTGPWMHDGRSPSIDDAIRRHAAMSLVGVDVKPLLAFLATQTDVQFLRNPGLMKPANGCTVPDTLYRTASAN